MENWSSRRGGRCIALQVVCTALSYCRSPMRNHTSKRIGVVLLISALACSEQHAGSAAGVTPHIPLRREITITTVPLLVREQSRDFPFLREDFAKGGVLDGKEVYGFSPSGITVVEGDTIHFTFINPEDDVHSFVLPDLSVPLPSQQITTATYVAKRAGIYPFVCSVASHLPMMSGQLTVLAATAVQSAGQ